MSSTNGECRNEVHESPDKEHFGTPPPVTDLREGLFYLLLTDVLTDW